jgi:nucleolar protein 4
VSTLLEKLDKKSPKLLGLKPVSEEIAWKEKFVARTLAQLTAVDLRKRHCRLIVRNLSFEANEANVADKLGQFGPLVEVNIPRVLVKNESKTEGNKKRKFNKRGNDTAEEKLKSRGFAFATFLCANDAAAAVQSTSASAGDKALRVCNRQVAIDYCERKDRYLEADKSDGGEAKTGLSKDEAEASGQGDADDDGDDGEEGDDRNKSDDDDFEEDDDGEDDEVDDNISDDDRKDEEIDDGDDEDDKDEEEDDEKNPNDDVNEGCTVFLRGLSLDADQADLKRAARAFGKVALAIIVKTPDGTSRGSAFIKFSSKSEAQACVEMANRGPGLVVRDRACKADIAVDRDKAQRIKEEQKTKKDKRNLYLANEGLSLSPAELKDMPEEEKDKRRRAQVDKKKKLLNPLFAVSSQRLSIRNLSKKLDDSELKVFSFLLHSRTIFQPKKV